MYMYIARSKGITGIKHSIFTVIITMPQEVQPYHTLPGDSYTSLVEVANKSSNKPHTSSMVPGTNVLVSYPNDSACTYMLHTCTCT